MKRKKCYVDKNMNKKYNKEIKKISKEEIQKIKKSK